MAEATWVRSLYLYVMCAVCVVLVGFGAVSVVLGIVHTVAPDLGHRDTLDRVGIGVANIASEVVDVFNETVVDNAEESCSFLDGDEFDECVADQEAANVDGDEFSSIQDGIASVKDELRSQIRHNSVDQVIKGVLLIVAGFVLFRIHGGRTELFARGLFPKADAQRVGPEPDPLGGETVEV